MLTLHLPLGGTTTYRVHMQLHDAQGKRLYLTAEERSTRPSGAARGMPTSRSGRELQPSADYFGCDPAEGALTLGRARP